MILTVIAEGQGKMNLERQHSSSRQDGTKWNPRCNSDCKAVTDKLLLSLCKALPTEK